MLRPPVHALLATLLMCAATAAYTFHMPEFGRFFQGHNDFLPRYTQARMAGSGRMFDIEADYREQERVAGFHLANTYHNRFPWQALLWSPLGRLPYGTAYWIWIGLNVASFALLVRLWLWPRGYALWGAVYFPVAASLIVGQDALMLALCLAGVLILAERRCDVAAGLLLALCTAKPHLFLLAPVALVARRRWRLLGAAAAGCAVLFGLSFLAAGPDWLGRFAALTQRQALDAGLDVSRRPSVFQLGVNGGTILLAVALAAGFCVAIWRTRTLESGLALAVVGSVLVAPHISVYDLPVLLVALVALPLEGRAGWVRIALLTPVPYWALLNGPPWSFLLPALLISTAPLPPKN